jgi:regulator of protease activity HflC (stomatin/prohibitin superfamily)
VDEGADQPTTGPAAGRRLSVAEAAEALGISGDAVRSRIKRGTLPTVREGGRVFVVLDATDRLSAQAQPTAQPGEDRLYDEMAARIRYLEGQAGERSAGEGRRAPPLVAEVVRGVALPDDSLLRRVRAARAEYQLTDLLTRVSRQMLEEQRIEMIRAHDQGMSDEVQSELWQAFEAQMAEVQERLTEVSRASRELEAALAEASLESFQLRSDALKQQATFAGGALIGTAAVTEVLLPKEQVAQPLLWASYGILLVTICASLLLLHLEAWNTERILSSGEHRLRSRILRGTYWASVCGLPLAVLAFVAFAVLNIL